MQLDATIYCKLSQIPSSPKLVGCGIWVLGVDNWSNSTVACCCHTTIFFILYFFKTSSISFSLCAMSYFVVLERLWPSTTLNSTLLSFWFKAFGESQQLRTHLPRSCQLPEQNRLATWSPQRPLQQAMDSDSRKTHPRRPRKRPRETVQRPVAQIHPPSSLDLYLWQLWFALNDDLHGRENSEKEGERLEKLHPRVLALYSKVDLLLACDNKANLQTPNPITDEIPQQRSRNLGTPCHSNCQTSPRRCSSVPSWHQLHHHRFPHSCKARPNEDQWTREWTPTSFSAATIDPTRTKKILFFSFESQRLWLTGQICAHAAHTCLSQV